MSKKGKKRVLNRKLKRTIRYTFATLCMITAITVAAIPAPKNVAEEDPNLEEVSSENTEEMDYRGDYKYEVYDDRSEENGAVVPEDKDGKPEHDSKSTSGKYYQSINSDLSKYHRESHAEQEKYYKAYGVVDLGNEEYVINWQYKYYQESKGLVLCEYNSQFEQKNITIGNTLIGDYYTVTEEELNAANLENLSFSLNYDEYLTPGTNEKKTIIEKYVKDRDEYNAWTRKCIDWQERWNTWNQSEDKVDADEPVMEESQKEYKLDFADLSFDAKAQYYCEFVYTKKEGKNFNHFTLISAKDNRRLTVSDNIIKKIYLVKKIDDAASPDIEIDSNGFACKTVKDDFLYAIGDYAFKGVGNVDTLNMTGQISGIGDYAFANSFIKSVSLGNVSVIGNAAFKGTELSNADLANVKKIGAEAFANCKYLKDLSFSANTEYIGAGAFSNCTNLESLILDNINTDYTIGDYAFYNCVNLKPGKEYTGENMIMNLPDGKAQNSLKSIGEGAFAVERGSDLQDTYFVLPSNLNDLPNKLFAGRSKLKWVIFPDSYGARSENARVFPQGMFIGCSGLEYVKFPDNCKYLNLFPENGESYGKVFFDVQTNDFYVEGPGYLYDNETECTTRKSMRGQIQMRESKFVPYKFYNTSGILCYEVQEGGYLLEANEEKNSLTQISKPDNSDPDKNYAELVIPSYVGSIKIDTLDSECISDGIKREIKSLYIEDDSISRIERDAFSNCEKLEKVTIGNSVNYIGEKAFENCKNLVDVTFHSPKIAYNEFEIGTDAFATGSQRLTFHGDIIEDYEPFRWATDQKNYMNKSSGVRVCYESLFPTNLKVMYDDNQNAVTLIDYPKYVDIDQKAKDNYILIEPDYKDKYHISDEEAETNDVFKLIERFYYSEYSNEQYRDLQEAFKKSWDDLSEIEKNDSKSLQGFYEKADQEGTYGPWISPQWIANDFHNASTPSDPTPGDQSLVDFFRPVLKVLAAETEPKPYFDVFPYSVVDKYEKPDPRKEWRSSLNATEIGMINACLNIDLPDAIKSIDIKTFITGKKSNAENIRQYLDPSSPVYTMYSMSYASDDIYGGLFSGKFKDSRKIGNSFQEKNCPYETEEKGNDYLQSIKLRGVTYLPDYAFDSCENLQSVEIGSNCESMGMIPFRGCTSLNFIDTDENAYYEFDNGILYKNTNGENGDLTLVECSPGRTNSVNIESDPLLANVVKLEPGAFFGCGNIKQVDFTDIASNASKPFKQITEDAFRYCKNLNMVTLPSSVDSIQDHAFSGCSITLLATINGKEVFISTTAFDHDPTDPTLDVTLKSYLGSAAEEYASYYGMNFELIGDTYRVVFLDYDGKQIGETQYIEKDKNATPPADPTRSGYKFTGWSGSYIGITEDTILIAQYQADGSGSGGSGGSGSGGSGSGGSGGSGSSSDGKYVLTVIGGTGSGSYAAGTNVIISAENPPKGKTFYNWTMSTTMSIVSSRSAATTITMPASNATVTANFIDSGSGYLTVSTNEVQPLKKTVTGNSTTNNNSNSSNNTGSSTVTKDGTKVSITKPGISNRDLAAAKVNGSTDNFIVKISESALATEEVQKALLAKYGSLDSIRYIAMDISLYDATGTTQITDTTGLTVDVTIPIPDELIAYAGNNKAGAVSNGVLEDLTPKFTTIDGVACVTFRATHFSPYTIYVDTNNMVSGMLDQTPKTGDGIAPKWVLSIGLAAISILLFMKKEKAPVKKKTA